MRYVCFIAIVFFSLSVKAQSKEKNHVIVVISDEMRKDAAAKQKLNQPDVNNNITEVESNKNEKKAIIDGSRNAQPSPVNPTQQSAESEKQVLNEQKNAYTDNNPLFIHKPDNDGDNYQTAKAEWVKNYPAEYEAWVKSNTTSSIHKISAKEFKTMPKDRQDNILSNPDKYIITEDE